MDEFQVVCSIINTALIPLLGVFMFYDSKRREARAKARRDEITNDASVSDEWQELYRISEKKREAQGEKIDQLYKEKELDRHRIHELETANNELSLNYVTAKFRECQKRGCNERTPPTGF